MELASTNVVQRPHSSDRLELKAEAGCSFGREIQLLRRGDSMGNDRTEKKGRKQWRRSHYALWYDLYIWTGHSVVKEAGQSHSFEVLMPSAKGHLCCLKKLEAGSPLALSKSDNKKPFTKKLQDQAQRGVHGGVFNAPFLVSKACLPLWGRNWVAWVSKFLPSISHLKELNRTVPWPVRAAWATWKAEVDARCSGV